MHCIVLCILWFSHRFDNIACEKWIVLQIFILYRYMEEKMEWLNISHIYIFVEQCIVTLSEGWVDQKFLQINNHGCHFDSRSANSTDQCVENPYVVIQEVYKFNGTDCTCNTDLCNPDPQKKGSGHSGVGLHL